MTEVEEPGGQYRKASLGSLFAFACGGLLATGAVAAIAYGLSKALFKVDLELYGWGVFVAIPFMAGFFSSLVMEIDERRSVGDHLRAALLSFAIPAAGLLVLGIEGAVCIGMAIPLVLPLNLIGAAVGRGVMTLVWARKNRPPLAASLLVLLPFALVAERPLAPDSHTRLVRTQVRIAASPKRVWSFLHELDDLPEPSELLFRGGVAYPVGVETQGEGVGAARVCRLSTGPMPERVTVWEPGHLLRFKVLKTPPTMREMNPFRTVHAPHLQGYYECLEGEFRLQPLWGGGTLLIGESLYRHRFAPAAYWSLWTDGIVRQVHLRVLGEIKRKAEAEEG